MSKRITGRSDDVSHNNGRRKLLKALGAGGGALVVSAMLPGRWIKPLARIGVLPAHAQMSNGGQYIPRSIQSSWPVPQGVISITITATGGKGGDATGGTGGYGGRSTATFPVSFGQVIQIILGPAGSGSYPRPGGDTGLGGDYNGGDGGQGDNAGGAGGGAATVVRIVGGDTLMIVGGGGGGGYNANGGHGAGSGTAGDYVAGTNGTTSGDGRAGTNTGGAGGTGGDEDGQPGTGPSGSPASAGGDGGGNHDYGGGGGGGGYGGGGGGVATEAPDDEPGAGGGGSGWLHSSAQSPSGSVGSPSANGDGTVTITW